MKKALITALFTAMVLGIASNALAGKKKNPPRNTRAVEEILKEIGGDHFPEKMRISKIGTLEIGEDYYHTFCGTIKKGGFRVLFFDNTPQYLGYYATEYEPFDYEEKAVLLDSGDTDENGSVTPFRIPITKKGPAKKVRIDGVPTEFIKNEAAKIDPKVKKAKKKGNSEDQKASSNGEVVPEYREWSFKKGNRWIKFRAIYIKHAMGNKVSLKEEKRGMTNDFAIKSLSEADREYLKQFK